ncbi:hypothetical protein PG990_010151 [Apiospora arundinis]
MASEMRVNVANELLRDSTCRRRKANQDVICDRVEAWHHDPKNKRKIPEIDEACCEIAKLRDVIIPDIYWLPDLQETLKEQLYAIYSAIDMLKARSFKDVELFVRALGEARNGYADPGSWPCDIDNEHMEIMLAVVELAITKAKRSFGWPPNQKTQHMLWQSRGGTGAGLSLPEEGPEGHIAADVRPFQNVQHDL